MLAPLLKRPPDEAQRAADALAHDSQLQTALHYFPGRLPPRARRRVQDYIAAHLGQRITNDVLAEVAGLSVCHFTRVFKQTEGMSPHRYVLHCRVERAKELLADAKMSQAQIAFAAGFSDQSHYTRWFRQISGLTPGGYRWLTR